MSMTGDELGKIEEKSSDFSNESIDDSIPMTNIWLPVPLRDELKKIKIIDRESWYSVIQRLVNEHNAKLKKK